MIAVTFTSHPPCAAPQTDKTALSLSVSPALYAHDTSSSFVICLSLPSHTSSLTAGRLSFICKYTWWATKSGDRRKRNVFLLLKNKQSHNLAGVPLLYSSPSSIGRGLQRDWGLLSPIMGWRLTGAVNTQWWLMGKGNEVDSARKDPCREENRGGGAGQNKPKLETPKWISALWGENVMCFISLHFSMVIILIRSTTGLLWINLDKFITNCIMVICMVSLYYNEYTKKTKTMLHLCQT